MSERIYPATIIPYLRKVTMMNRLRNNWVKKCFGIALLVMLLLKVFAFSISHFSSCADPLAIEKSAEEGKDTKEGNFDKNEKKLLTCEFFAIDHGHLLWIDPLPVCTYSYKKQIGSHPVKTVPTPPPNQLV